MGAERADAYLAAKGYFPSRAQARAAILAGAVRVDGRVIAKAGEPLREGSVVEVRRPARFVSRGAEKLDGALDALRVDVSGMRFLDAGASTGGFTDCLLARGCREVVAVDVGYGQLAWKLRNDPRVVVLERTNVRGLALEAVGGECDGAVADLSFISLRVVLPAIAKIVSAGGPMIVLFKPQFEAGKGRVGKGGVVREPGLHAELLLDFAQWAEERGFGPIGLVRSTITGADGNIEFFWWLATGSVRMVTDEAVLDVVERAHEAA